MGIKGGAGGGGGGGRSGLCKGWGGGRSGRLEGVWVEGGAGGGRGGGANVDVFVTRRVTKSIISLLCEWASRGRRFSKRLFILAYTSLSIAALGFVFLKTLRRVTVVRKLQHGQFYLRKHSSK